MHQSSLLLKTKDFHANRIFPLFSILFLLVYSSLHLYPLQITRFFIFFLSFSTNHTSPTLFSLFLHSIPRNSFNKWLPFQLITLISLLTLSLSHFLLFFSFSHDPTFNTYRYFSIHLQLLYTLSVYPIYVQLDLLFFFFKSLV